MAEPQTLLTLFDDPGLTPVEAAALNDLEASIARGFGVFVEVGTALLRIRDERLYRASHRTFEDYCRERWNISRSRAHRLIEAAETVGDLLPIGNTPANEAQVRPLTRLPADERAAAWEEAVATAPDGRLTAAHVTAIVDQRIQPARDPEGAPTGDGIAAGRVKRPVLVCPVCNNLHIEREFGQRCPYCHTYESPIEYQPEKVDLSQVTTRELKDIIRERDEDTRLWNNRILLSSESQEWYTPARYIYAARTVLGGFDVDPASSELANKTVQAERFYTEADNGLAYDWPGRVWLNPPYGQLVGAFIGRLVQQFTDGIVTEAITLVNAHATDTQWFRPLWSHTLCFTDHRINFEAPDGKGVGSTHGNVFVYLGPDPLRFKAVFQQFGPVVVRL